MSSGPALLSRASTQARPARERPRWRVLAIGAHPDDVELGCGASLARWAGEGAEIHCLILSRGEIGGDGAERVTEAKNGAALLGAVQVEVLGFPDTEFPYATRKLTQAIEAAINRVQPRLILTHSANDTHQDHQTVHEATFRAARQRNSLLCYESPSVTQEFQPTYFVDVTGYVDAKVSAVSAHDGQATKPYMAADRIRTQAAYRGIQARVHDAEAYEPVRLLARIGELP